MEHANRINFDFIKLIIGGSGAVNDDCIFLFYLSTNL